MIRLDQETRDQFLAIYRENGILLEGNLIKILDADGDAEFAEYLRVSSENDKTGRRKRLEITKQIQKQNAELVAAQDENMKLMEELKGALESAEKAKDAALTDLDLLQKKTQTELIGTIVKVALWVICGVGVVTTILYIISMLMGVDTTLIGTAWSNMFGILLTNSFSIIGTIMGVKYATGDKGSNK